MSRSPVVLNNLPGAPTLPPDEWKHERSVVDPKVLGIKIDSEDHPWMPSGYFDQKYLRLNMETGEWIIIVKIPPGKPVPYHKHHAPLFLWVFEGTLNYIEEQWSAGPGTLVYEPPGNTHTEVSDDGCTVLIWSSGPLEFLNEDLTPAVVRDPVMWKQEIEQFHAVNDLPMPTSPGYFW
ncbi:cupin domain-containing protein [Paenarthrobacter aurescens]|uniref:cupin domain-containing protein n=1 Tax=Paenarthrobacter aurescens TaxID=43663 RepID=UPI00131F472E|nr:cupin domain-containing protein [Paenarthrobacter aurescens]